MYAKRTKVHKGLHGYEATYNLIQTSGGGEIDPPQKWSTWTVHSRVIGPPGLIIAAMPGPPLLQMDPPCSLDEFR